MLREEQYHIYNYHINIFQNKIIINHGSQPKKKKFSPILPIPMIHTNLGAFCGRSNNTRWPTLTYWYWEAALLVVSLWLPPFARASWYHIGWISIQYFQIHISFWFSLEEHRKWIFAFWKTLSSFLLCNKRK